MNVFSNEMLNGSLFSIRHAYRNQELAVIALTKPHLSWLYRVNMLFRFGFWLSNGFVSALRHHELFSVSALCHHELYSVAGLSVLDDGTDI
jgi:hypothetical protein